MADSDVAITAGTGTKVDTRTVGAGTDEHRQVVVVGDPTTAANVASADATNGLDVDVTRVQGTVTVDSELPAAAAMADGAANPTAPAMDSRGMTWNGTTWDRQKSMPTSAGPNPPAGIIPVGICTSRNNADGTTMEVIAPDWLGDAGGMGGGLPAANWMYNGSSWDRIRGDITNGQDVDVTRMSALVAGSAEVGKVQISDGTDVATVLPVRTQPATTEKALNTVELPSRLATYQVVTAEVAPAITIGVKELFNFFSPAAVTQDVYIVEIVVSVLVTTASTTGGRTNVEVLKTTTAGTGGTNVAPADLGGAGASAVVTNSAANVMQVKTGGGALGTAYIRQGVEHATMPLGNNRFVLFQASSVGNGICMRGGAADGLNIQVNRVAGHTALVDQWTASMRWIEL